MTIEDVLKKELKRHISNIKTMKNGNLHKMTMGVVEKSLVSMVLDETKGNQSETARILGINRNTLRNKIREYGIPAR